MRVKKKWQRAADEGSNADQLRVEVVAALLERLESLGLSREALGIRARLGGSYVHEMAAGHLNPTLRSIGRLVAVMDRVEGIDDHTIAVVRELCQTVDDAEQWVKAARERIKRGSRLSRLRTDR